MRSEQCKGELVQAAQSFYNAVAIHAVVIGVDRSGIGWQGVMAAGARLRLALLDQQPASVVADGLQPIAPTALRTNEVHPEAVDVRFDLAEADEDLLAANALEHADGVPRSHYRPVTPITLSNIKPPRDLRTDVLKEAGRG
jgi:hypothetical protein